MRHMNRALDLLRNGSSAFLSENSNKADQISHVVAKTEKQLQYRSQLFLFLEIRQRRKILRIKSHLGFFLCLVANRE